MLRVFENPGEDKVSRGQNESHNALFLADHRKYQQFLWQAQFGNQAMGLRRRPSSVDLLLYHLSGQSTPSPQPSFPSRTFCDRQSADFRDGLLLLRFDVRLGTSLALKVGVKPK